MTDDLRKRIEEGRKNGIIVDSIKKPVDVNKVVDELFGSNNSEDEDVSVSYPSTWPKPSKAVPAHPDPSDKDAMDKIFRDIFDIDDKDPSVPIIDSSLMTDEEKDKEKQRRKPNVVNASFDVCIGNPLRNGHQKCGVMNSQGNNLYFSHYRG
jgi:hypothetical protein